MTDASDRVRLLALARAAIEAKLSNRPLPHVPEDLNGDAFGVFVTARCQGQLRGCLGTLEARERLGDAVVRLAANVTDQDPRFPPIEPSELGDLTIELSVLSAPAPVLDPLTIVVGRDGLIVEDGRRKGLLLPQVATEHGWDRETLLSQTCIKAGLSPSAWRTGASISRFEAEVFGEA